MEWFCLQLYWVLGRQMACMHVFYGAACFVELAWLHCWLMAAVAMTLLYNFVLDLWNLIWAFSLCQFSHSKKKRTTEFNFLASEIYILIQGLIGLISLSVRFSWHLLIKWMHAFVRVEGSDTQLYLIVLAA